MRRHIFCVVIAFVLLLAIIAMAGNLVGSGSGLDLSGRDPVVLRPATVSFLSKIRGQVSFTYFVSSKDRLPAQMKRVEETMRSLLSAFKQAAPDHVNVAIIDPDLDPQNGAAYAARKAIAPVKMRRVRFDASSEQAVWSALDIAFNDYPNAIVPFISSDDLSYLQDLIVNNLQMMSQPPRAVVGVAAPDQNYLELPKILSSLPQVAPVKIDFEKTAILPRAVDLFIWIAPKVVEEQHLRELERFVGAGRSVVIVANDRELICSAPVVGVSCRVEGRTGRLQSLLRPFGLGVRNEIVIDGEAKRIVRFPAVLTDIKALSGFTIGELHVSSVTAFEPDPDLLNQSGFDAQVVATTSADTRLLQISQGAFGPEAIKRSVAVPKQPWIVRLNPKDPWRGSVLAIGSASLFNDALIRSSENSNNLILKAAVETFTSNDRLARLKVERRLPEELPELQASQRLIWRIIVIGFLPVLAIFFGARRGVISLAPSIGVSIGRPVKVGAAVFAVIIATFTLLHSYRGIILDLSSSAAFSSSSAVASLRSAIAERPTAELIISRKRDWPTQLKDTEIRIEKLLNSLGIDYKTLYPDQLTEDQNHELSAIGVRPFPVERVDGDSTVRSYLWAGLRFSLGDVRTAVPRIEPRMLDDLQFLIGTALLRLQSKSPGPLIGLVSDIPRLTSAQAYEEYTQMGYTPPEGSNPFGEVANLLERYGYRIRSINPNEPVFDADLDLVVWLQPRAPVELLSRFGEYLARGGRALVALQQYKIKQRQYRGRGYDTVYWPEPQTHRFNAYLDLIGVSQMGEKSGPPAEILMDVNQGRLSLDTRVYQRSRYRELLRQEVVRPFLIRAVGAGLSKSSPITSGLGSLLFIWGNRFVLDRERSDALGLQVSTLVSTSPRPWRFMWNGGWIPEPALSAPTPEQYLDGPAPLVLSIKGRFPLVQPRVGNQLNPIEVSGDSHSSPPTELLISASSEMFSDSNLYLENYQHDRFLLNAVASLAYREDLAQLQSRVRYPPSFGVLSVAEKMIWRLIVIGFAPLLLILYWFRDKHRIAI